MLIKLFVRKNALNNEVFLGKRFQKKANARLFAEPHNKTTDTSLKMYSSKSKSTQFLNYSKSTITDKNYLITVTWLFVIRYFTPLPMKHV